VEREISFRTECGLYYSYYKQMLQAPTLTQGNQAGGPRLLPSAVRQNVGAGVLHAPVASPLTSRHSRTVFRSRRSWFCKIACNCPVPAVLIPKEIPATSHFLVDFSLDRLGTGIPDVLSETSRHFNHESCDCLQGPHLALCPHTCHFPAFFLFPRGLEPLSFLY
jgi:hypothetical protein